MRRDVTEVMVHLALHHFLRKQNTLVPLVLLDNGNVYCPLQRLALASRFTASLFI